MEIGFLTFQGHISSKKKKKKPSSVEKLFVNKVCELLISCKILHLG